MINPKGHTADELREMGYTVADAVRGGYSISNDDDRFVVAYKGPWPHTEEFVFMHRESSKDPDWRQLYGDLKVKADADAKSMALLLDPAGPGWQAVVDEITRQAYPVNGERTWVQWSPGAIATYALFALRSTWERGVRA